MVIAVFGSSGKTGRLVIEQALERGIEVRAFCRNRAFAPMEHPNLTVVKGAFPKPETVRETVRGADAVIVAIGPQPPYTDTFCADVTRSIIDAMKEESVRRLVVLTGAMIGPETPGMSKPFRWIRRFVHRQMPQIMIDREEQVRVVESSGFDWTILRPPRLTDGPKAAAYRTGEELRVGVLSVVSRATLAGALLDTAENREVAGSSLLVV